MNEFFIKKMTVGQLNAVVKFISGQTGIKDTDEIVRQLDMGFWKIVSTGEDVLIASNILVVKNQTIQQAIAAGNYDWHNDLIPQKFTHDNSLVGKWEFKLINPNRDISSEDAKKMCEVDGWQVGDIEHELAIGAQFPSLQKDGPIIALGSVCEHYGSRRVPALWTDGARRELRLYDWDGDWPSHFRFLSVRPLSES